MKLELSLLVFGILLMGCLNESIDEKPVPELDLDLVEQEVFDLINEKRKVKSIDPLLLDLDLRRIAQAHSQDMAENDFFDYENEQGELPVDRAEKIGYNCTREYDQAYSKGIAESIYQTSHAKKLFETGEVAEYNTEKEIAEKVIKGWVEGQNKNFFSSNYTRVGMGIAKEQGHKVYVTADFC